MLDFFFRLCWLHLAVNFMFSANQRALPLCSNTQEACRSYLFLETCIQNSLVQFGAVPDHVPLARHWRVIEPVSKYPSMHEYTMEWEKVVPSRREMRPWVGVAGLLHCTAERRDSRGRRWRSKMQNSNGFFIFHISNSQDEGLDPTEWIWMTSEGLQMPPGLCDVIFLTLIFRTSIKITILHLNRWFVVLFSHLCASNYTDMSNADLILDGATYTEFSITVMLWGAIKHRSDSAKNPKHVEQS